MKKEYDFKKMKEVKNPFKGRAKKGVGINLSPEVIDYFKSMRKKNSVPYQRLIDMYLLDCVKKKRTLTLKWTG